MSRRLGIPKLTDTHNGPVTFRRALLARQKIMAMDGGRWRINPRTNVETDINLNIILNTYLMIILDTYLMIILNTYLMIILDIYFDTISSTKVVINFCFVLWIIIDTISMLNLNLVLISLTTWWKPRAIHSLCFAYPGTSKNRRAFCPKHDLTADSSMVTTILVSVVA